jgi:CRISPR-associated endoribonuclease Cas6
LEQGPSGFADWPRPFVFRATHLDGRTIHAGETFYFDLNLFDLENPAIAYLVLAFSQLAQEGLGPGRGRADLVEVSQLDAEGKPSAVVRDKTSGLLQSGELSPMTLDLQSGSGRVGRIRVRFVTPTELKTGKQVTGRPQFGVLASRIRDRLSKLSELYGGGPLEMDFKAFGERAALVQMTHAKLDKVDVERRSSRTGQTHSIGGFVGEAEYEGELTEFVPFLRAARWTGVGRQTVWGKGEIEVVPYPRE